MAILQSVGKYKSLGLLIIRVGLGIAMVIHGTPKLMGGPAGWEGIGGAMGSVGITFMPTFWGFMAAVSEAIGGLLLIVGFLFRPACLLLMATMLMAAVMHMTKGDGYSGYSHALDLLIVFTGLFFTGPGSYAIDRETVATDKYRL